MKHIPVVALVVISLLFVIPVVSAQTAKPVQTPRPAPTAQAADPAATLPTPILAAFTQSYPKATIKNASKETEDGKTVWEVESIDGGLARDLMYNPDGTVIDIEEEIAMANVPPAVADALKAKFAKATVTKAEKRTAGKAVTYEFTLKGAKEASIELTPDGKIVPAKKEKDEKDEDDEKTEKKAPIKK